MTASLFPIKPYLPISLNIYEECYFASYFEMLFIAPCQGLLYGRLGDGGILYDILQIWGSRLSALTPDKVNQFTFYSLEALELNIETP